MTTSASSNSRSITESPWYWAYLFCTGGLIALVMIGPKYAQRQTQIEQNGQKRLWAAQLVAGRAESDSPTESEEPLITLWPLFVVLGAVLAVAWIKLIRDHFKRRGQVAELSKSGEPGPVDVSSIDGGHP